MGRPGKFGRGGEFRSFLRAANSSKFLERLSVGASRSAFPFANNGLGNAEPLSKCLLSEVELAADPADYARYLESFGCSPHVVSLYHGIIAMSRHNGVNGGSK